MNQSSPGAHATDVKNATSRQLVAQIGTRSTRTRPPTTREEGGGNAQAVSPRMFETALFERFSRAHPSMPALVYGPVAAGSILLATQRSPSWYVIRNVILGYLAWTLTEYWLHRLLFHLPISGPKTARLHFLIHGVHHDYPWDKTRLVMPLGASFFLCILTYAVFRLLLGPVSMLAPFGGFVLGYVLYDTVHWYVHAHSPRRGLLGWIRREHFLHHFKDPATRFGVSCPWLDSVFRTRRPATLDAT